MAPRSMVTLVALAALVSVGLSTPARGQGSEDAATWVPQRLADGQPDIQGMWNNVTASSTPLELPDGFSGQDFSKEDLDAIAAARAERRCLRGVLV